MYKNINSNRLKYKNQYVVFCVVFVYSSEILYIFQKDNYYIRKQMYTRSYT